MLKLSTITFDGLNQDQLNDRLLECIVGEDDDHDLAVMAINIVELFDAASSGEIDSARFGSGMFASAYLDRKDCADFLEWIADECRVSWQYSAVGPHWIGDAYGGYITDYSMTGITIDLEDLTVIKSRYGRAEVYYGEITDFDSLASESIWFGESYGHSVKALIVEDNCEYVDSAVTVRIEDRILTVIDHDDDIRIDIAIDAAPDWWRHLRALSCDLVLIEGDLTEHGDNVLVDIRRGEGVPTGIYVAEEWIECTIW